MRTLANESQELAVELQSFKNVLKAIHLLMLLLKKYIFIS